jgi:hypothetical protein
MPREIRTEWRTINHKLKEGSGPSEVYFLKRTSDGSEWIAFKEKEYEKPLNDILAHLEKMHEILKRPTFGGRTPTSAMAEAVFCTNCGRRETSGHNYCGWCGTALPK